MTEQNTATKIFYNSDKTGSLDLTDFYVDPLKGYNCFINDFKVVLNLSNNRTITLDYNKGEFKNEDFKGKLIKIDPEGSELSEEEKVETIKKLGNLIAETFVPFYKSPQFKEGTRLLKMAADEFLEREEADNILLNDYLESVNEAVSNYTEKTKTDFRKVIINNYEAINNVLGPSFFNKFKNNPKDFIIKFLKDNYRNNPAITEKIFESIKVEFEANCKREEREEKREEFMSIFCQKELFEELSPEQYGKLSAIFARLTGIDLKYKPMFDQMIDHINKSDYKTKINDFSKSFAKTSYDSLFTEVIDDLNVANYSNYIEPILVSLKEDTYKNTIVVDMCNEMQSYITKAENEFSKLRFFNAIDETFNKVHYTDKIPDYIKKDPNRKVMENFIEKNKKRKLECFEITEETKYACILSILDSLTLLSDEEIERTNGLEEIKNYIGNIGAYGNMYIDLLCKGKMDKNKVQKYFKVIKKIGFDVTDMVKSAMNNIKDRQNIYPCIKEYLINRLFIDFKKYKETKTKTKTTGRQRSSKSNRDVVALKNDILGKVGDNKVSKTINGKTTEGKISVNSRKELLDLFFDQQKSVIDNTKLTAGGLPDGEMKQELEKTAENNQTKLENNKIIIETLRQNDPESFYGFDIESYNENKKETSISKAGSVLAGLLYDKSNNKDVLEQYFDGFKNLGFPVGEVVISAAESISKDKEIYPFVREAIVDNLYNTYTTTDYHKKQQLREIENEKSEFRTIKQEIDKVDSKDKDNEGRPIMVKRPIIVKNKEGKDISLDLTSESLDSFLNQEEEGIRNSPDSPDFNEEFNKKKMSSILEKNKKMIQKLRENSPELFVKSNEAARSFR